MIHDVTYTNKNTELDIKNLVGRPYSLIERIKLRGIGTSKMIIYDSSELIKKYIYNSNSTQYCFLELRTKGLIIGFSSQLRVYNWTIPFRELSIYYNGGLLSIYDNKDFLKIKPAFSIPVDRKFLKKVLLLKAKHLENTRMS